MFLNTFNDPVWILGSNNRNEEILSYYTHPDVKRVEEETGDRIVFSKVSFCNLDFGDGSEFGLVNTRKDKNFL